MLIAITVDYRCSIFSAMAAFGCALWAIFLVDGSEEGGWRSIVRCSDSYGGRHVAEVAGVLPSFADPLNTSEWRHADGAALQTAGGFDQQTIGERARDERTATQMVRGKARPLHSAWLGAG